MIEVSIRLINFVIYTLWQILPIDVASGIGSFIVRLLTIRHRGISLATRKTLLQINPGLAETELDQILFNMWQNIGRLWSESIITHRLVKHRLKVSGTEYLKQSMAMDGPIIVPFLHIGNWELITHVLVANGLALHSIIEIQRKKIFEKMISQVRKSNNLVEIQPDFEGTRKIYRCLQRGEALGIALDEYKNGKVLGPKFGRNVTESNNLEFSLRLAKKFNAILLPMYISRLPGVNFELHISPPITADLLQNSESLNQVRQDLENWREKKIREHIDQWYMLHRLRFNQ